MTRSILCLSMLVALPIGCGQDPANKTRNDNAEVFDDAVFQIELATQALPEDVKTRRPQYRQTELGKAEALLKPIASTGAPKSQLAVRSLLAEIEKSKALTEASDAVSIWARQGGLSTRLLTLASDIRLAGADAEAHEAIDLTKELAAAREIESKLVAEKDELSKASADLEAKVAELTGKIDDLDKRRTALVSDADKLNRQAFTSKGEERHSLVVQAAKATDEADKLTAEREKLDVDRDIAQSQLKLVQTELDHLTREKGRLAATRSAIASIEQRDDKHKQLAAASRDKAQALYANNPVTIEVAGERKPIDLSFVNGFKELTTRQDEVTGKFANAVTQVEAAISSAKQGQANSGGSTAEGAQLDVAARQVLLGFILQEQVMIDSGYRELLKGIGTAFEPVNLESAQSTKASITEAINTADTRVTETKAKATETFTTAIASLDKIIESAKSAKEAQTEATAIDLKIAALRGLAAVSGDEAQAAGVTGLKTRLSELQAP